MSYMCTLLWRFSLYIQEPTVAICTSVSSPVFSNAMKCSWNLVPVVLWYRVLDFIFSKFQHVELISGPRRNVLFFVHKKKLLFASLYWFTWVLFLIFFFLKTNVLKKCILLIFFLFQVSMCAMSNQCTTPSHPNIPWALIYIILILWHWKWIRGLRIENISLCAGLDRYPWHKF